MPFYSGISKEVKATTNGDVFSKRHRLIAEQLLLLSSLIARTLCVTSVSSLFIFQPLPFPLFFLCVLVRSNPSTDNMTILFYLFFFFVIVIGSVATRRNAAYGTSLNRIKKTKEDNSTRVCVDVKRTVFAMSSQGNPRCTPVGIVRLISTRTTASKFHVSFCFCIDASPVGSIGAIEIDRITTSLTSSVFLTSN